MATLAISPTDLSYAIQLCRENGVDYSGIEYDGTTTTIPDRDATPGVTLVSYIQNLVASGTFVADANASIAAEDAAESASGPGHTHVLADVSGLVSALAGKSDTGHTHTTTEITDFDSAVDAKISTVIDSAPGALDTLNELAASLGDDADFAGTMTTALAGKAASVHTHAISDVTNLQTELNTKLASTSYTAADVLAKLITVDGSGTTLDADTVDGYHENQLAKLVNTKLSGGLGSASTAGVQDWNDVTNTTSGMGATLLLGSHANGPSTDYPNTAGNYFHAVNYEYVRNDGTGNVTQIAIPYSTPSLGQYQRSRFSNTWTSWTKIATTSRGSWTPTITRSTSAPTVTYTSQAGGWVRSGNIVTLTGRVTFSAMSGGSGNYRIEGVPFVAVSYGNSWYPVQFAYSSWSSNNSPTTGIFHNALSYIDLYKYNGADPRDGINSTISSQDGTGDLIFQLTIEVA